MVAEEIELMAEPAQPQIEQKEGGDSEDEKENAEGNAPKRCEAMPLPHEQLPAGQCACFL